MSLLRAREDLEVQISSAFLIESEVIDGNSDRSMAGGQEMRARVVAR
jgi:hypothetical protein